MTEQNTVTLLYDGQETISPYLTAPSWFVNLIRENEPEYGTKKEPLDETVREKLEKLAKSKTPLNLLLTNDFAFKTAFHNIKALKGFLSASLYIPLSEIISIEFQDPIERGEYARDREGILDLKVLLNGDRKINVELQVKKFLFWEERSLFYNCKMFIENFKKGQSYGSLENCIHISILDFDLGENDGLYSVIELRNAKTGRLYSDKFSFRVLYLNHVKDASEEEKKTEIYKWARLLSAKDWEELKEIAAHNEYMREVVNEMEKINADESLRYQYLREMMRESDIATIRLTGFVEGEEKGRRDGEEKGRREDRNTINQLNQFLLRDNRLEDLKRSAADLSFQEELLQEYKLL